MPFLYATSKLQELHIQLLQDNVKFTCEIHVFDCTKKYNLFDTFIEVAKSINMYIWCPIFVFPGYLDHY